MTPERRSVERVRISPPRGRVTAGTSRELMA